MQFCFAINTSPIWGYILNFSAVAILGLAVVESPVSVDSGAFALMTLHPPDSSSVEQPAAARLPWLWLSIESVALGLFALDLLLKMGYMGFGKWFSKSWHRLYLATVRPAHLRSRAHDVLVGGGWLLSQRLAGGSRVGSAGGAL